jgi:hypothetical protein
MMMMMMMMMIKWVLKEEDVDWIQMADDRV